MKESDDSLAKSRGLPPEKELKYFKAVVRSLMNDASKVLANIELLSHGVFFRTHWKPALRLPTGYESLTLAVDEALSFR